MSVFAVKGRNWTLVISAVLALNTLVNLGLAASTPNETVAATFASVQAQETDLSQGDVVIEKVLDNDNRAIFQELYDSGSDRLLNEGTAAFVFGKRALTGPVDVTLTISEVPATNYPTDDYFARNYPAERVRHLGPRVTAEFPLAPLAWQIDEDKSIVIINPSFYEGALETVETHNVFLEVRILRPDGELVFYTFDYGFFGEVPISNTFLQTNLLGSVPETLKISVQAVDLSRILPDPGALPGTMPE